jgi:hypothetical protein
LPVTVVLCPCADAVRRLEREMRVLQLALLAGGAEREMTVREAHESGLLKPKPRTVEHWRADPDLRQRWRAPSRIEKWRGALAERDKKAKAAGRQPAARYQGTQQHANDITDQQ